MQYLLFCLFYQGHKIINTSDLFSYRFGANKQEGVLVLGSK